MEALNPQEAASRAPLMVKKLIEDIGLPTNFQAVGLPKDAMPDMLQAVFKTCTIMNPLRPTKDDLKKLLERIWDGKLQAENKN